MLGWNLLSLKISTIVLSSLAMWLFVVISSRDYYKSCDTSIIQKIVTAIENYATGNKISLLELERLLYFELKVFVVFHCLKLCVISVTTTENSHFFGNES